ncbi:MAG: NAD(+) diphosphatase [Hyphomonadaceae bacterium]|nr:NAD(+) diphosphatase [Hyphomonadaceae bacterium]
MTLLPENPNAFTRSPLDRAAHHRRDREWINAALEHSNTKVVPFFQHRPFVVERAGEVAIGWLGAHTLGRIASEEAPLLFLGLDREQTPHFAVMATDGELLADLGRFDDLRALGPRLTRNELAILGPAKSVFEWHARHGFCAHCGAATLIVEAGWRRDCPACKAEHFPRVDPVCIMLPTFSDKCLLGRQRAWPRGMHSALAGFIEPGETIEEAVARETLEEAGLIVSEVTLHSTQPWPFPHSLMIGALAEVTHDAERIDPHELESARWFSREEARALIAGSFQGAFCPPPFAIAHQLLKTWALR